VDQKNVQRHPGVVYSRRTPAPKLKYQRSQIIGFAPASGLGTPLNCGECQDSTTLAVAGGLDAAVNLASAGATFQVKRSSNHTGETTPPAPTSDQILESAIRNLHSRVIQNKYHLFLITVYSRSNIIVSATIQPYQQRWPESLKTLIASRGCLGDPRQLGRLHYPGIRDA